MIKTKINNDGVLVQTEGHKSILMAELMASICAITETMIKDYNMTPEETTKEMEKCYKAGTTFAIERLKK